MIPRSLDGRIHHEDCWQEGGHEDCAAAHTRKIDAERDMFAAAALTGCLAYSHVNPGRGNYQENATPDEVAESAYRYADAMMVARAARGEK